MYTTVHKILIHSLQVISSAIFPIGQLLKEAQEVRNKDVKKYREGFTHKHFYKSHYFQIIFEQLNTILHFEAIQNTARFKST